MIYAQPAGRPPLLRLGDGLGELTSEVPAGTYVSRYVSTGQKSYGYEVKDEKTDAVVETVIKVRGITLTSPIAQKLNFDTLTRLVDDYLENRTVTKVDVKGTRIFRTAERCVYTGAYTKTFRFTANKRVFKDDGTSLPYGYK